MSSETFNCEFCAKTFSGQWAAGNLRRHRRDRHNIPLSRQPKRNKWDNHKKKIRFNGRHFTIEEFEIVLSIASRNPALMKKDDGCRNGMESKTDIYLL